MKDGHPQEPGRRLNRLRGRGKAAHAEPVSAWVAWAQVFYAAETCAPIPDSAGGRLQLPDGFSARDVIDWLAQGYGWRARSPQNGRHYGLFERLAGVVVPLSGRQGQQLYPHCGTKPPRSSRADYCGDCAKLINALKSRRRRSVDTSARRILRWILPDRKDPAHRPCARSSTSEVGSITQSFRSALRDCRGQRINQPTEGMSDNSPGAPDAE